MSWWRLSITPNLSSCWPWVTLWSWGTAGGWVGLRACCRSDHGRIMSDLEIRLNIIAGHRCMEPIITLTFSRTCPWSAHRHVSTNTNSAAYLQHIDTRSHWACRCTWLHSGRECWHTHQCRSGTWCQWSLGQANTEVRGHREAEEDKCTCYAWLQRAEVPGLGLSCLDNT